MRGWACSLRAAAQRGWSLGLDTTDRGGSASEEGRITVAFWGNGISAHVLIAKCSVPSGWTAKGKSSVPEKNWDKLASMDYVERIQMWAPRYQRARGLRFREPSDQQCSLTSSVRQMREGIGGHSNDWGWELQTDSRNSSIQPPHRETWLNSNMAHIGLKPCSSDDDPAPLKCLPQKAQC